jgi:hypothetical protein
MSGWISGIQPYQISGWISGIRPYRISGWISGSSIWYPAGYWI